MKQQLSPGVTAGIIAVVVLLLGTVGYAIFLRPAPSGSGDNSPSAKSYKEMQTKMRDPNFMAQMKAQHETGPVAKRGAYPGGGNSQQMMEQMRQHYESGH